MDGGPLQNPPQQSVPSSLALEQQQQPEGSRAVAIKTEWMPQQAGLGAKPAAVQVASVGTSQGTLEVGTGSARPGEALLPWDRRGGWCRGATASGPRAGSVRQQGSCGEEVPSVDTQQEQQQHPKRARKQAQPQPVRTRALGGLAATMPPVPQLGTQQQQQQQQQEQQQQQPGLDWAHEQSAAAVDQEGTGHARAGPTPDAKDSQQQEQEPQAADVSWLLRLWTRLPNGWRRLFDSSNPQPSCMSIPGAVVKDLGLEGGTATFVHQELGTWEVGLIYTKQKQWRLVGGYPIMHTELKVERGDSFVLERVPRSDWAQGTPTVRISIERGAGSAGRAAAGGAILAAQEAGEGGSGGSRRHNQREVEGKEAPGIGRGLWKQLPNGWRRLLDGSDQRPKSLSLPGAVVKDLGLEEGAATFVHQDLGKRELGISCYGQKDQVQWVVQRGYMPMHRQLQVEPGDALVLEKVPRSDWAQGTPTVRISIERGPGSAGRAAAAVTSSAAPEAVECGRGGQRKRTQLELEQEEEDLSEAEEEQDSDADSDQESQDEGQGAGAAREAAPALPSAASNGQRLRRGYRYLMMPAPPPGCPPVAFGTAAGRDWWLHSDESLGTRLTMYDLESCSLKFQWVVAERLGIKQAQPVTLIVQGSGGGQWNGEVAGGQGARPYTLQRHFGKMLWDIEAQAGDLIKFWPLRPGPAGYTAQMVVAVEKGMEREEQQQQEQAPGDVLLQAPDAGSDDGELFEEGQSHSTTRAWRKHPDGSLSTVLPVAHNNQHYLPIRSSVAAALGLRYAQTLELVEQGTGRSWEVELAGGPSYKLQRGFAQMLRDVGGQGADVIRLWPAAPGAAGKLCQLQFAVQPKRRREQLGSGLAAGLSTPLLVQAKPLPEAPAPFGARRAGALEPHAQGTMEQLPNQVAGARQGQALGQGQQLQPATDLRLPPASYVSVQPGGSVPQKGGLVPERMAHPAAAAGSHLPPMRLAPQQISFQQQQDHHHHQQQQSAGMERASGLWHPPPAAAQMQGSGWQHRERAGQETSPSAQVGYGPWTPSPARGPWTAQQAQQRGSELQSSSQGGKGSPPPYSSRLGGGSGSGNVSGSPPGPGTAHPVGTPAAGLPGLGRAAQQAQQARQAQQAGDPFAQLAELQEVLERAALTPPELSHFEQAWLGMTAEQQGSAYRTVTRAAADVAAGGSRELLRQAVQAALTGEPAGGGAGDDPFLMLNELQGALQQASLTPNTLLDLELAWLDMQQPQRRAIHRALMHAAAIAAAAAPGAAAADALAVVQEMAKRAVASVRAGGKDAHEALCRLQDMCTEGQVEATLLGRLELAWLGQRSCHWFASMERMLGRASSQGREALSQAVAAVVRSCGGGAGC